MSILALARPEIVALKAYSHASWDPAFDRLHANELPWRAETDRSSAGLNRYPEPHPHELAARLAGLYGVRADQLLPGRGSDESIDLVVRGFCRAGLDNVIICPPTFGMYSVAARIQGAAVREVPLHPERDFALDAAAVLAACDANTRIVFLCSPNNPTGTALDPAVVTAVLNAASGMVVVDEAYAEFSHSPTLLPELAGLPRLVITRTMSKAFAFAGARVGYLAADPAVVDALRLVRLPYHLSALTQAAALAALRHADETLGQVAQLRADRDRLVSELRAMGLDVVDSDANFVLFGRFHDQTVQWQGLLDRGILVRDVGLPGWLRVSVGTTGECDAFLAAVREVI